MKAYGIFPRIDMTVEDDPRVNSCHSLVTELVCDCLRADGDTYHVAVDWRDPDGEAWGMCTEGVAQPHVVRLETAEAMQELVRLSTDPLSIRGASAIRSMATCRAATFGHDGQAFLCLRHEDNPPVSPNRELIEVAERPELLTDTDYFDGVIVNPSPLVNGG